MDLVAFVIRPPPDTDAGCCRRRRVGLSKTAHGPAFLRRFAAAGTPLKDTSGRSPLMGLKTGLNEAFVIDAATRDRLIRRTRQSDGGHQAVAARPGRRPLEEPGSGAS